MDNTDIKLYMIPGSGTDWRMYTPQMEQFTNLHVPEWLPPLELKEPLDSYARRLSARIDVTSNYVLGGVSLGGMIAQQMALSLRPQALILISTCGSYKALPLLWRIAGKITRMLPNIAVKFLFFLLSKMVSVAKLRRKEIYARMLQEMPPRLVRWQSGVATEWELERKIQVPVYQLHGGKDPVIPVKNIKNADAVIINDGGHLINITHEKEVNAFITESLNKASRNLRDNTLHIAEG
jgi:pimeloyl-ACP methyl ester carboxylesterase